MCLTYLSEFRGAFSRRRQGERLLRMRGTAQCRVPHTGWGLDTSPRSVMSCVLRVFWSTGCPFGCVLEVLATRRLQLSLPNIIHAWRSCSKRRAVCHRGGMRYSTPSLAGIDGHGYMLTYGTCIPRSHVARVESSGASSS